MIAIADYGVGNIFSLVSSFKFIGVDAYLTKNPDDLKTADKIILPGGGAFEDAAKKLKDSGMWDAIIAETAKATTNGSIQLSRYLTVNTASAAITA